MDKKSNNFQKALLIAILILPIVIFLIGVLQHHVVIMAVAVLLFFINYYICFSSLAEKFVTVAKETLAVPCEAKSNKEKNEESDKESEEEVDETWDLKEIFSRVFVLTFGNYYDLAMRFLRYQEYYESPCPDFKGTVFTLLDYMDWYAKANSGVFSYPDDWAGYNVPGWVFKKVLEPGKIEDWNQYDEFMLSIVNEIRTKLPSDSQDQFYLIGVKKGDEKTIEHEMAHAFYYVATEYKLEMDKLIANLQNKQPELIQATYECLEDMGYDHSVFDDELQAYFATGLDETMVDKFEKQQISYKDTCVEFKSIFDKWNTKRIIEQTSLLS